MKNKGFTLIELLVVVAIIGILSSVVLASLNGARTKGADAAIKSNLANIRAQAEMVYDDAPGSYANVCANATVLAAIDSAKSAAGVSAATVTTYATAGTSTTAVCHAVAGSWAVDVPLKSSSANSWCVDSSGSSVQLTGAYLAASDTTCSTSTTTP